MVHLVGFGMHWPMYVSLTGLKWNYVKSDFKFVSNDRSSGIIGLLNKMVS